MKRILVITLSVLLAACGKTDPENTGGTGIKRSDIVSITKSYSFSCNSNLKTLADISIVYVGADGKPSAPEKLAGLSWKRSGIAVPLTKATALDETTAGFSVICNPNNGVPENGEYDIQYEAECAYTITCMDGSTFTLPAWNINPQMPAAEGRYAEETCNAVSLSCTNDKVIYIDNQGNTYLSDTEFWSVEEGEYVPAGDQGGANQEPPTQSVSVEYADTPEAVDLGFTVDGKPLLWATRNVGARSPGDFGGLYGWGDASGFHTDPNPVFYPARNPKDVVGKTGNSISGTRCDIAFCTWGPQWRMPSKAEWEALAADCNCTWKKKKVDGNLGMEFTSRINGKSIFLPAADARHGENLYRNSTSEENRHGYYWAGDWVSTDAQFAYHFYYSLFSTGTVYSKAQGNKERFYGMSVRPVTSGPIR